VLADHFETLTQVHEERYEPTHGPLRPMVRAVVGRFLDCGLLEHGFARVRCATCRAEFLVAFRCKGRGFCPSCQARRLAEWSLWLDEQLFAPVAHRGEVRVRYYGAYASRRRGWWRRRGVVLAGAGHKDTQGTEHEAEPWPALQARRRRWAELLRMVFKVEVEVCPRCGGEMRIIAFVIERAVITKILAHLERRGVEARAGPWAAAAG